MRLPRGITLLETMIYIGLMMIILPMFTIFILHIWQEDIGFDGRMRLEQSTSLILLEFTNELTQADAITTSTSTLGSDTSVLRFRDATNATVVIDTVSTSIDFSGTSQTVRRLRLQRGATPAVWLTEPEHNVTQWRVDAVRNTAGTLTGIRINFDAQLMNSSTSTPYRNASMALDTTVDLQPHTIEN